ncbi:MAG: hypothetical protein B5766_03060 [Candidatus Lumbricidophila eiseniae]|uniref:Thiol-disulfide oxidoreductase n=1 Tax=Candidatus Lumbricidiphila eiseniae TaxID=1969409 RepID=A0A2A6FU00_9MICO|nr:MAG: hypothetical protein B5766_03060 [Candidatus Lumbricidophila eiseniae]
MEELPSLPVLIFDGDCGFCTASVNWLLTHLPHEFRAIPFQWYPYGEHGLTDEDVAAKVWFVDASGDPLGGHLAVGALLSAQPGGWKLLSYLIRIPPTRWLAALGYWFVARNRYRLPGGTPACAVPR